MTDAPPITVRLTLFADLKRFLPKGQDGPLSFAVDRGTTVDALLAVAGIPAAEEITGRPERRPAAARRHP